MSTFCFSRSHLCVLTFSFLLLSTISATAQQVYEADNGITASGSGTTRKVSLGGALTGHTTIPFDGFNVHFTGLGNIGIRTNNPLAPLHIFKNVSSNYDPVLILEDGLADGRVIFQMKGTGSTYHLGVGNASEANGLANKFFIWDENGQVPRLVLDPTGNIGIGTNNPSGLIHLTAGASSTVPVFKITETNYAAPTDARLEFFQDNGSATLKLNTRSGTSSLEFLSSGVVAGFIRYTSQGFQIAAGAANSTINFAHKILPVTNGNLDIGSTGRLWSNLYVKSMIANGDINKIKFLGNRDDGAYAYGAVRIESPYTFVNQPYFAVGNEATTFFAVHKDGALNIGLGEGEGFNQKSIAHPTAMVDIKSTEANLDLLKVRDFANVPQLLVTKDGNVAIGNITPTAQLHTTGTVRFAGITNDNALTRVLVSDVNGNLAYRDAGTLVAGGVAWSLGGNAGTTAGTDFLGTTDDEDLVFKTNSVERIRLTPAGQMHMMGDITMLNQGDFASGSIRFLSASGGQLMLTAGTTNPIWLNGNLKFGSSATFYNFLNSPVMQIYDGSVDNYSQPIRIYRPISLNNTSGEPHIYGRNDLEITFGTMDDLNNKSFTISHGTGASVRESLVKILENGNVGIGTANPAAQLHTTSTVRFAGLTNNNSLTQVLVSDANGNLAYRDAGTLEGGWSLDGNVVSAEKKIGPASAFPLHIITSDVTRIYIDETGKVGIGTTAIEDGDYKLYVEGSVRTRKVRVDQLNWADYVFEPEYPLLPLHEVEKFINKNKHLPEVPSAAVVAEEGLDLGDNQVVLLKKIEELTLYLLQQNKKLEALQQVVTEQQQQIENLKKEVHNSK